MSRNKTKEGKREEKKKTRSKDKEDNKSEVHYQNNRR